MGENPIPCILIYSNTDGVMYVYGMNGELIHKDKEKSGKIINVGLGKDKNFNDAFIYINKDRKSVV